MKYLLLFLVLYYGGRFFIRFLLPVVRFSYAANKQMKHMRHAQQQQQDYYSAQQGNTPPPRRPQQDKQGDYIDYVEIK